MGPRGPRSPQPGPAAEQAAVLEFWRQLGLPASRPGPPMPRLTAVIAHLGAPDYGEFLDLARRYPGVYLDTTMAFTDFMERLAPFPAALRPRLADMADRILLGSDFPSIPYPYLHQLQALDRLDFGPAWLQAVCYRNAARLLRL